MNIPNRNIQSGLPQIRQLSEDAANRIAAGEVVERPASAVKDLVENALDAGATKVTVDIAHGGKSLIRVTDNGHGIAEDQLTLALSRHATSKIDGNDLINIRSFGFRGEALPSLGAVGRLKITSRALGAKDAYSLAVEGGSMSAVRPDVLAEGTVVELRDLFFATPARLKFMRSDRAETQSISDCIKRLAMAEPQVGFTLVDRTQDAPKEMLGFAHREGDFFDLRAARIGEILGSDFIKNAATIDAPKEGLRLSGYAGLPTYSRGSSVHQYVL